MLRNRRIGRTAKSVSVVAIVIFACVLTSSIYAQVTVEEEDDGHRRTIMVKHGDILDHTDWTSEHCEGSEECEVEVKVINGERIVIVNGDTVETGEMGNFTGMLDHHRPMFDRVFTDRLLWHEPLSDNTLHEMERDARKLARKARLADDGEKAELEVELDQKLSEIFDYKNGKRREAIETTEKRLDEMRERQSKRESLRADIIEQRKQELLGEESHLEW